MEISKKKFAALQAAAARGRKGAKSAAKGMKTSAIAGVAGVGAELAAMVASSKIEKVATTPIGGVALMAAGHLLARKNAALGFALLGAGGFWASMGTRAFMQIRKANKQQAQGYDAGVLVNHYGDAGALVNGPALEWAPAAATAAYPQLETPQASMMLPSAFAEEPAAAAADASAYYEAYSLDGG